jgi:hypothetical protein
MRYLWRVGVECSALVVCVSERDESVVCDAIATLLDELLPLTLVADAADVLEQPDLLRLTGQCAERLPALVVVPQHEFLAVQDRRVEGIGVGAVIHLAVGEINQPTLAQRWKRIIEEARIVQQGYPLGALIESHRVVL